MGNIVVRSARVPPSADVRVEQAFLVMENDEADNNHWYTIVAMPSRARRWPKQVDNFSPEVKNECKWVACSSGWEKKIMSLFYCLTA